MGQLAEVLRQLHQLEIFDENESPTTLNAIHRDICPANILISRDGDVLLGGFGSATSRWISPGSNV